MSEQAMSEQTQAEHTQSGLVKPEQHNMLIAQSGGPTAAINASITGAIVCGLASDQIRTVLGAVNGMQGFLEGRIINISDQIKSTDDIELLRHTPGHALGSSRYKIPKQSEEIYAQITAILKSYDIKYFFYNGGNDSMDTVNKLSAYLKEQGEDITAVGIPKTVDNDLERTDHCPGFGSAARYVATSIAELYLDTIVYPIPAVTIVEVMGRNAGWLTAAAALARDTGVPAPHLIYLPEVDFDEQAFLEQVRDLIAKEQQIVIAASEGIHRANGEYLADTGAEVDMFGHKTLGGVANYLEKLVKSLEIPKLKTRAVQLSSLQRSAAHCASGIDLAESFECGYRAVEAALSGKTDLMIAITRVSDEPYLTRYDEVRLAEVANSEKKIPLEWITGDASNVTPKMLSYLRPLVAGEAVEPMRAGLPRFFRFSWADVVLPDDVCGR